MKTQESDEMFRRRSRARLPVSSCFKGFCLLAVLALLGCHTGEESKSDPPAPKIEGETVIFATNAPQLASIEVQSAEPRHIAVQHVTGRLYWNDEKTVRVFSPVAGRVIDLKTDLGAPISPGTPLAEIDSPDFAQAAADARTARANLMAADKAYTRAKELLDHGAAAQKDVETAEAAYASALAERDRAEARLANYGGSDKTTNSVYMLRSPLKGEVVEINLNPGQEVRADQMLANAPNLFAPAFVVSDPTTLWLQVDVAETDLHSLQTRLQLHVACKAFPGQVFDGVIEKIGDTMDPGTRTVKIRGVVNNPKKLLKAEMYVMVDVLQDVGGLTQAGVNVPSSALFMKGEDSYLFVESSPAHYQRKRVKVGTEQDNKVTVYEGVDAGQQVVTEGALLLQALVEPVGS